MNVYDFDNTIYDGESTFDLFLFYLKRNPKLVFMFPTVVSAFAKYKKGLISLDEMADKYAPLVQQKSKGMVDFKKDPVIFWDEHIKNIKPFYKDIQKEDDLIITCSPDYHIEEICRRLGIKHFIASTVNQSNGAIERICMKDNKVKAFFEEYGESEIDDFYTDSAENDGPLIDIAKHAYIVKKDKITKIK